jgi:hypothetical protein
MGASVGSFKLRSRAFVRRTTESFWRDAKPPKAAAYFTPQMMYDFNGGKPLNATAE